MIEVDASDLERAVKNMTQVAQDFVSGVEHCVADAIGTTQTQVQPHWRQPIATEVQSGSGAAVGVMTFTRTVRVAVKPRAGRVTVQRMGGFSFDNPNSPISVGSAALEQNVDQMVPQVMSEV